ncbi:hypothetical protein JVU11DRAFT_1918 [Chiua virens]|nr:hypothetical protein JVU11DRAFT_1918 [Chiua virens]
MSNNVLNPSFSDEIPFPSLPPSTATISEHRSLPTAASMLVPTTYSKTIPMIPAPTTKSMFPLLQISRNQPTADSNIWVTPFWAFIVTGLLNDMYPNLRVGPATKIRALMVGNPTLAAISRRYELPAQLRLHPAQAITLRASVNIQGNLTWEGCISIRVLLSVEKWLRALFRPYSTEAYTRVRAQHRLPPLPASIPLPLTPSASVSSSSSGADSASSVPTSIGNQNLRTSSSTPARRTVLQHPHASGTPTTTGHLALFNQQLQRARREFEWVYDNGVAEGTTTTPIWAVRVEVDGEVYGRGKGGTKKAARN